MDEGAARRAIHARFASSFGATAPYAFENEDYKPTRGVAWVRFRVASRPTSQSTLGQTGGRRFQREGMTIAEIRVPRGIGLRATDDLVAVVRPIFEGVTFDGIWFHAVDAPERGNEVESGLDWFRTDVIGYFSYDEVV